MRRAAPEPPEPFEPIGAPRARHGRAEQVTVPSNTPTTVHVQGESGLTKVARVFAILRDIAIIAIIGAVLWFGSSLVDAIGDAANGADTGPAPTATDDLPCATPTTDTWGTYCPTTTEGG